MLKIMLLKSNSRISATSINTSGLKRLKDIEKNSQHINNHENLDFHEMVLSIFIK